MVKVISFNVGSSDSKWKTRVQVCSKISVPFLDRTTFARNRNRATFLRPVFWLGPSRRCKFVAWAESFGRFVTTRQHFGSEKFRKCLGWEPKICPDERLRDFRSRPATIPIPSGFWSEDRASQAFLKMFQFILIGDVNKCVLNKSHWICDS